MQNTDLSNKQEKSPLIVALDYPDMDSALLMAKSLDPDYCRVKVGKELYTRCGPAILESLHKLGFEVFLDLKFHDIPNTTSNAVAVAADLGVWMVNVHASGGRKMMEACVSKLSSYQCKPLLIAVTVLTSMQNDDLLELGVNVSAQEQVNRLASLSKEVGMDGVVCSSHEVTDLKKNLGSEFKLVTPGIRPAFAAVGDQKRIMTPREAVQAGSDYLVVGRPITKAESPMEALSKIRQELEGV